MQKPHKNINKTQMTLLKALVILALASTALSQLSGNYYEQVCPQALPTIKRVVENAVYNERRMGASLLRLHFHDCFVNGCDGSLLLDATANMDSEKNSQANRNSARGFEVVDQIKAEVDKACGRPVVSCADILAVAARDSVVALGGPTWPVQLGRKDSRTASIAQADADIPSPFMDLPALINTFKRQGLDEEDLVALSGGHTIGFSQCRLFRSRIYNETNIDPYFAQALKQNCPSSGGDTNLSPLDPTTEKFDVGYFSNLVEKKGLLHSDQELFNGGVTDESVREYVKDVKEFFDDFGESMVKMGNIKVLTGERGEVRVNCRVAN